MSMNACHFYRYTSSILPPFLFVVFFSFFRTETAVFSKQT